MRINLFLTLFWVLLGVILWVTLSGASLAFAGLILLIFIFITIGYPEKAVLFILGARELKSNDEPLFFQAAAQEAYKLAVPVPALYFYDGALERAFILQSRGQSSIVMSKRLLKSSTDEDLHAICFELLLQVRKGLAGKRTKVMFLVALVSWFSHSCLAIILKPIRKREWVQAADIVLNYFIHPWISFIFRLSMGQSYFKKLKGYLQEYPAEMERLQYTGLKLEKPANLYSLPSRKLMELTSVTKNRHFQSILSIEILPHEWDYFFQEGLTGAE